MIKICRFSILFVLFIQACIPPSKEVKSDVDINIKDPITQQIIDLQDRGLSDSLITFFDHKDPNYRYLAARAFASIKDKNVIDTLATLLDDPNMDIKSIAAYSLGQIGAEEATALLIDAFIDQDTLDVDNTLNSNLLEALGKISGDAIMRNIAAVESYRLDDTLLLLGQVRSLYRFGLKGIKSKEATKAVLKYSFDREYPESVRLIAANYLARNKNLDLSLYDQELLRQFRREENPNIRMCFAIALRNLKENSSLVPEILNMYNSEKDYRVKVYLIKALSEFSYINVVEPIMKMTKEKNVHVALTAAQFLSDKGNKSDAYLYRELLRDGMPWQVRAKVFEAIMKHIPIYYTNVKNNLKNEILEYYNETDNVYEKAAYITSLSHDPYQYTTLFTLNRATKDPILKTAIAEGLKRTINGPFFIKAYGGSYIKVARSIVDTLIVEAKNGGSGVIANLSGILKIKGYNWNRIIRDTSWQDDIISALSLPRDIEAYNEFGSAIATVNDTTFTAITPQFNHPIDWTIINALTDSSRIVMKTSKGNITIKLFPISAPGTVANFIDLCQTDYYDGKVFHRVVPNFVIQGGCPIGDGYGGLDYTIRSELSPKYYDKEGYIGMASAGNHTEGVQFFITHSPTPHLDGRYTIFGKVTKGMDVIHDIQIGDQIIDAILTYE